MSDSEGDQTGIPLFEDSSESDSPHAPASAKRNRDAEPGIVSKKPVKRRKLGKPKDVDDEALDVEQGINYAIAHMDSRLMADHLAQRTKTFRPELSLIELEDTYISERAIVDTTSWIKSRNVDQLPGFLEQFSRSRGKKRGQKLSDAPQEKGHPHTVVVAGSALRAADLNRGLRKFQTKEGLVAKLFAKHIKLKEAVKLVKKSRINIGVGTPQRIIDLLDNGALSSSQLERVIVDASHIDQKKRGILDMKETQAPLVELLTRNELKERYVSGDSRIELLFF